MVESDGVNCTCIYTSSGNGNGERTMKQLCSHLPSCLSRRVECIGRFVSLCKRWLHPIKPGTQRPWSDLPNDILISIASLLGRVECIRFMSVCKGWLHSIKPAHASDHHLKPCLLAMEKSDLGCLSLYTPFPSKIYKFRIPELKDTIFRFSKDGWILLSKITINDPCSLFLFNLLTGAKFDLPVPDFCTLYKCYYGICFTSTPGCSDFMVVVIDAILIDEVTIYTYRPSSSSSSSNTLLKKEEKWTEECYENSSRTSFHYVSCNPIFYKGKLYCLDNYGHLGVFDLVRKNWITVVDRPVIDEFESHPAFRYFPYKSFMVDLEGEDLISVFVNKRKTEQVHIFRLKLKNCCSKMGWEKVYNLGTAELFVGLSTSISTVQLPYGSWNKLYFPGFKTNLGFALMDKGFKTNLGFALMDKDILEIKTWTAYSLETNQYDPSCTSFWRDPLRFTWIELPMSKWESIYHSKWKRM